MGFSEEGAEQGLTPALLRTGDSGIGDSHCCGT